ncbi:MAG: hypothetical protein AABZ44_05055 [Elusimicrobiota bacterium]
MFKPLPPVAPENRERKKLFAIFALGAVIVGVLFVWLVLPMFDFGNKEDKLDLYGELANSMGNTEMEEGYLDSVNQPVDSGITDADEGSLALIKHDRIEDEDSKLERGMRRERNRRSADPRRVRSMANVRDKKVGKLSKLSGFGIRDRGGASGSKYGYGAGDMKNWAERFKKGSGFQGANVATGPNAKKGTQFGASKGRHIPDSKSDQLASAMSKKFDQGGGMGRAVNPSEALKNLAGSVPADLKKNMGNQGGAKADSPRGERSPKNESHDPCEGIEATSTGDALLQLGLGVGMMFATGALMGGGSEETSKSKSFVDSEGYTVTKKSSEGSNPAWGKLGEGVMGIGMEQTKQGLMGLMDPNKPIRDCKSGKPSGPLGMGGSS